MAQETATTTPPDPAVPTPDANVEEKRETVRGQIEAMKERIARGERAVPPPDGEPGEPAGPKPKEATDAVQEREATEVPVRAEAGDRQEVREGLGREGRGAEEQEAETETEAETVADTEQPREGEPLDVPEGDEPDGSRETFTLQLPGRRAGDAARRLELDGLEPDELEGLRRLQNGYLRRESYEADLARVQAQAHEIEETLTALKLDPVGFLAGELPSEVKTVVARHLLADPNVYQAVAEELYSWEDETTRRAVTAELALDRQTRAQNAAQQLAVLRASQSRAREIRGELVRMAKGMDDDAADQFVQRGLRDIQDYVERNRLEDLEPGQVEAVLRETGLLRMFRNGSTSPSAAVRRVTRPTDTSPEVDATAAAKELRDRSARKRATMVAPAGSAAAPTSTVTPPEFQTVRDGIEWLRKKWGV